MFQLPSKAWHRFECNNFHLNFIKTVVGKVRQLRHCLRLSLIEVSLHRNRPTTPSPLLALISLSAMPLRRQTETRERRKRKNGKLSWILLLVRFPLKNVCIGEKQNESSGKHKIRFARDLHRIFPLNWKIKG